MWKTASIHYEDLKHWLYRGADPRSKDMLFMQSMDGMVLITLGYIVLATVGPRLMANRKAFDLKWTMFVYNVAMTAMSLWMFLEMSISTWKADYNYVCDHRRDHPTSNPRDLRVANALWWYFVSKPIEFSDTLFMVLKKKNSQVTILHIWHHAFMFPYLFVAVLIGPGGNVAILPAAINALVHVVMYGYYALSLFPALHPYLGWKKYLTQMQLVQFVIIIVNTVYASWISCDYPQFMLNAGPVFYLSLVVLFGNFYVQAYRKRKQHVRSAHKAVNGHAEHAKSQ